MAKTLTASSALALLFFLWGCQSYDEERAPLHDAARKKLMERIQHPRDAGLTLTQRPDGSTRALNSHHFSAGDTDTLPMLTRPHSRQLPLLRCRVNGRVSYTLVDTGSTRSIMDYRGALRTKLIPVMPPTSEPNQEPVFHTEPIRGLGGEMNSIFSIANTFSLGEFQLNTVPFYILDDQWGLAGHGWLSGFRVETLLGFDIIKQFEYATFDYKKDRITLSREPFPDLSESAQAAPLYIRFGLPVVPAQLAGKPVLAVLDTGGDFGMWLPRSIASKLPLTHQTQAQGLSRSKSIGGNTASRFIGHHPIDLGGVSIPPSPTYISMQPTTGPDLPFIFIGHRILKNYRVTFNPAEQRVIFEKE